jgi:hypothetical protein
VKSFIAEVGRHAACSSTGVVMHDQSRGVDWSHDGNQSQEVRSESGYMIGIISSDRSRAYNQSREIPAL